MTPDDVRRLALGLEGASERDHHGFPSYRRRTIFATVPDADTLRVMLSEEAIREAVAEFPAWTGEAYWGTRLAALRVDLAHAEERVVGEWLEDAWSAHG